MCMLLNFLFILLFLQDEPFIDIDIRTLDGFLPEEMTTDKRIKKLFENIHVSNPKSVSNYISTSILKTFGVSISLRATKCFQVLIDALYFD